MVLRPAEQFRDRAPVDAVVPLGDALRSVVVALDLARAAENIIVRHARFDILLPELEDRAARRHNLHELAEHHQA
jgi:hypothetical protein